MGGGNGGVGGGNDLLGLEPPSDLKPAASPISDTSATLTTDNNDTFTGKFFYPQKVIIYRKYTNN